MNFVAAGAEAERIEERRAAEGSPGRGRAAEDSLVGDRLAVGDILAAGDIREAGIPAAGIPAVDILPFRNPPADNLRKKRTRM